MLGHAGTTPDNATAEVSVDEYNRYMVREAKCLNGSCVDYIADL